MPRLKSNQPHIRDFTTPGWAMSLLLHALVAMGLVLVLQAPRGAMPEANPQAGIILAPRQTALDDPAEDQAIFEQESEAEGIPKESTIVPDIATTTDETLVPEDSLAASESQAVESLPKKPVASETSSLFAENFSKSGLPNLGAAIRSGGGWPHISGGQVRTGIFGVEGVGTKFVYLFDRSVSMEGAPLAAAKSQLVRSIESLGEVHQFQIVFFNHRLTIFDHTGGQGRIAYATDNNKLLAAEFVHKVLADGGTDRFAALAQAIRLKPDVIFFLTDADDPMPAGELAQIEAKNRRVGASINTIEFGRGVDRGNYNFLVRLAEQSGGQHGYVNTRKLRP